MQPLVIKLGGAILEDQGAGEHLFSAIAQCARPVVVVHGGGVQVDTLLARLGMSTEKVDGVRLTPTEQMPYIVGVLAGQANKQLALLAQQSGLKSVGISLLDGGISRCSQLDLSYGRVGTATAGDPTLLLQLLNAGFVPIVASIGADVDGQWLNVNADDAAVAVAQTLSAELLLLSDVIGVLDQDKQRLPTLNAQQIETLIAGGVIQGGMCAKVKAAVSAAEQLNQSVTIGSWHQALPYALATSLDQVSDTGTQIAPAKEDVTHEAD